jgi:hypothetical protein
MASGSVTPGNIKIGHFGPTQKIFLQALSAAQEIKFHIVTSQRELFQLQKGL